MIRQGRGDEDGWWWFGAGVNLGRGLGSITWGLGYFDTDTWEKYGVTANSATLSFCHECVPESAFIFALHCISHHTLVKFATRRMQTKRA